MAQNLAHGFLRNCHHDKVSHVLEWHSPSLRLLKREKLTRADPSPQLILLASFLYAVAAGRGIYEEIRQYRYFAVLVVSLLNEFVCTVHIDWIRVRLI